MCKQKIEKIIHSVKSPQTYKEFYPRSNAPMQPQLLGISSQVHRALFAFMAALDDTSDESNHSSYSIPNMSDIDLDESDGSDDRLHTLQLDLTTSPERYGN